MMNKNKGKQRDDNYADVSKIMDKIDSSSSDAHIQVVVRVRPENEKEAAGGFDKVVHVLDENVLIFDPKVDNSPDFYHGQRVRGRDFLKKKHKDIRFMFDCVFDGCSTNREVYEGTLRGILDGVFEGYNCSVFAYGATGAGKTFTMLGSLEHPGIVFHAMVDLYQRVEQLRDDKTCDIAVCYIEVYNEQIRDLLTPGAYLPIRDDPQKGTVITGLSFHKPASADELLNMLAFGNTKRTQHPTDANAESSRSHAVFQVYLRQKDRTANISTDVQVSKMSLIDLAGSERATVTTNRGARLREGANINRSLLALGNCINALADGKSNSYVPYRDSKLTRILKDSLGGNCKTVMIAAVSPSSMTYEDTLNTLKYADRAKSIKTSLKKNVMSVDFHVSRYAKIVDELRREILDLKEKVRQYEENTAVASASTVPSQIIVQRSPSSTADIERLQVTMYNIFQEKMTIHREAMELEFSERELIYRVWKKQRQLEKSLCVVTDSMAVEKIKSKMERTVALTEIKKDTLRGKKTDVHKRLEDNDSWLQRIQIDAAACGLNGEIPATLVSTLRMRCLEVEQQDVKQQLNFLQRMCRGQERDIQSTRKLLASCLPLVCKLFWLLRSYNLTSSDIVDEFEAVQQLVEGERDITWGDDCDNKEPENSNGGFTETSFDQLIDLKPVDDKLIKYLELPHGPGSAALQGENAQPPTKGPLTPLRPAVNNLKPQKRVNVSCISGKANADRVMPPNSSSMLQSTTRSLSNLSSDVKRLPNVGFKRSILSSTTLGPTPAKVRKENVSCVKSTVPYARNVISSSVSSNVSFVPATRTRTNVTSSVAINSTRQRHVHAATVSTMGDASNQRTQTASNANQMTFLSNFDADTKRSRLDAYGNHNSVAGSQPSNIRSPYNGLLEIKPSVIVANAKVTEIPAIVVDSTSDLVSTNVSRYEGFLRSLPSGGTSNDVIKDEHETSLQLGTVSGDLNDTFTMMDGVYPLPEESQEADVKVNNSVNNLSSLRTVSVNQNSQSYSHRESVDLFSSPSYTAINDSPSTAHGLKPGKQTSSGLTHQLGVTALASSGSTLSSPAYDLSVNSNQTALNCPLSNNKSQMYRSPLTSCDNLPLKSSVNTVTIKKSQNCTQTVSSDGRALPSADSYRELKKSKTTSDIHSGNLVQKRVVTSSQKIANPSPFKFRAPIGDTVTKFASKSARRHRRSVTADADKIKIGGARRAILQNKDVKISSSSTRARFPML